MCFLCSRYRALFSDRCIVFDVGICKRFPDLSGNVKKIIDGAGLQNTVRRVVFIPQDALLLVIPYFLGYAILADADCGALSVVIS